MAFEQQGKSEILKRLKDNVSNDLSKTEGTFNADMLSANAIEFEQAYNEMNLMIDASFANTSWGEYLTMRAMEFGVIRKQATKANAKLKISGEAGAKIIKNSLFATAEDLRFYTVVDTIIGAGGTTIVGAICGESGTIGNVEARTITKIPYSIPRITGVTNEQPAYDGFSEESDKDLLERYLLKVRTPATSGNANHYKMWALSVTGIGKAKVKPLWNGAGTVKVIVVDTDNNTASDTLIKQVADYIEEERPIGATVTVVSPSYFYINVVAEIRGENNIDAIKKAINDYFVKNGFESTYVSIAQVGKIILETDIVYDYKNLTLNGGKDNIPISDNQLPRAGTVTLNVITN